MPEAFLHHLMEIPSFGRIQGRYSMFSLLFPEANERVCRVFMASYLAVCSEAHTKLRKVTVTSALFWDISQLRVV